MKRNRTVTTYIQNITCYIICNGDNDNDHSNTVQ